MEGDPVLQYRPADELAHRLVRRSRGQEIPRHLGRALRGRQETEGQGPPVRLRAGPRFWRQPRLALSAAVVLWRARGRGRRQDRRRSTPTRPPSAVDFARKFFKDCMFDDVLGLDRCQQQQGVDGRADLVHQQCPEHPVVRQAQFPGHRQGHRPGAEPARAERPVPPDGLRSATRSSISRRKSRRRTISCAG